MFLLDLTRSRVSGVLIYRHQRSTWPCLICFSQPWRFYVVADAWRYFIGVLDIYSWFCDVLATVWCIVNVILATFRSFFLSCSQMPYLAQYFYDVSVCGVSNSLTIFKFTVMMQFEASICFYSFKKSLAITGRYTHRSFIDINGTLRLLLLF